ncbi:MAG: arylsulfatase [Bryobacteraceae bacterium]|nr:arylsulfatase [Bryobacteraceae bacterium]
MNRREFLGAAAGFAAGGPSAPAQVRKPNIVLILADDLGYGDLGCYGQRRIRTPHIDRLAAEGVRFTQAYAGSTVCAPSRCCLETGYHTGHARTRGNHSPDLELRPQDVTVAELLKNEGYRTGLAGKWSLGGMGTTGYPLRKGYDRFFGYFSQLHAHNYYPEHLLDNEREFLLRGNFGAKKADYAPDLFLERALEFLDAKDDRPFFLYFSSTIPHANNEMGRDTGDGMETPDYGPYAAEKWPRPEKGFAAMVSRLDDAVGRILGKLKQTGQDSNTFILFSSDNGPHREGGHDPDFFASRGPFRGIKRDLYEGGIRVPGIARWPARIAPGRVSEYPWAFWDFLPTCAEIAGAAAPKGLDGLSLVPALTSGSVPKREYFYWEFHERGYHQAVRIGDWKGVRFGRNRPVELYNLAESPGETDNVASRHPEVVRKLEEILASARVDSPIWPIRETPPASA